MVTRPLLAGAFGVGILGLLVILLPKPFDGVIALNLGWASFYGMMLFLDALPKYVNRENIKLTIVQLAVIGFLTPWIGLTVEVANNWFGKLFFAIYVVLPFLYEYSKNWFANRKIY